MKIEPIEVIDVASVKRIAHNLVKESQAELLEDGVSPRLCFIFTTADHIPRNIYGMYQLELIEGDNKPNNNDLSTTPVAMIVNLMPDHAGLLAMIGEAFPPAGKTLPTIVSTLGKIGTPESDIPAAVVGGFVKATSITEPQIITAFMKHMVKKVHAYAFIHISEMWGTLNPTGRPRSDFPDDLSKYKHRQEIVGINWETHNDGEFISYPFYRERDQVGKGKIVRFGDVDVKPRGTMHGRLFDILRPIDAN